MCNSVSQHFLACHFTLLPQIVTTTTIREVSSCHVDIFEKCMVLYISKAWRKLMGPCEALSLCLEKVCCNAFADEHEKNQLFSDIYLVAVGNSACCRVDTHSRGWHRICKDVSVLIIIVLKVSQLKLIILKTHTRNTSVWREQAEAASHVLLNMVHPQTFLCSSHCSPTAHLTGHTVHVCQICLLKIYIFLIINKAH